MEKKKTTDTPIYKKWWFWVAIVAVLAIIGLATQGGTDNTDTLNNGDNNGSNNSQNVGTLPTLNIADFKGQEGLVTFKDLVGRGYTVTAKYENENVPTTNQDLTKQFTNADINSCEARLGYDAYIVDSLTQDGDNVTLILTNEPNNNQTCPDGTVNDLPSNGGSNTTPTTSGYSAIYDKYAARLRAECPTLSITECATISNEGVTKMAEYMYSVSGVDGQYATYSEWSGKLMDVYMQSAR